MKARTKLILVMVTFLTAMTLAAGPQTDSARVMLEAAKKKEVVDGDLNGAIQQYKAVVARYPKERAVAADALVQMARCYQKLGDAEARKIYQRVTSEYADQKEAVAAARAALTGGVRDAGLAYRQVWSGPKVNFDGAVSPDGRLLSYVDPDTGDLAIHDFFTSEDRRLTNKGPSESKEYAEESAISPDGKQVVYGWWVTNRIHELRLIDLNAGSGKYRRLLHREDIGWFGPMRWSPDGKSIAILIHKPDQAFQIGLVSIADGALRILKTGGRHDNPTLAFSPDGKYIAHNLPAQGKTDRDIFLLTADGSIETPLVVDPANKFVIGWTPDSKHLLFATDRTGAMNAWAVPISDGKAQGATVLLKKDIGRPDTMGMTRSGALLYGMSQPEGPNVYVASVDLETGKLLSSPAKTIPDSLGPSRAADWSPDGKYLAYLSERDNGTVLSIRSLETGATRELRHGLKDLGGTKWSPDGRFIAVRATGSGEREGIYRINVQTGEAAPLVLSDPSGRTTNPGDTGFLGRPWWSPDGGTLYFVRNNPQDAVIVAHDLSSGREREVLRKKGMGTGEVINLSPDGRQFTFTITDQASRSNSLLVVSTGGGEPRELLRLNSPERIYCSAFSSDGKFIVFKKGTSNQDKLWLIPAAGGTPRQLEMSAGMVSNFSIHPDGHQLAFTANGGRKAEVWVLENFLTTLKTNK